MTLTQSELKRLAGEAPQGKWTNDAPLFVGLEYPEEEKQQVIQSLRIEL